MMRVVLLAIHSGLVASTSQGDDHDCIPPVPMVLTTASYNLSSKHNLCTPWLKTKLEGDYPEHYHDAIVAMGRKFLATRSVAVTEKNLLDLLFAHHYADWIICDTQPTHLDAMWSIALYNVEISRFPAEEINFLELKEFISLFLLSVKIDNPADFKAIADLTNPALRAVKLEDTNLTAFPRYLSQHRNLQTLIVRKNYITEICFDEDTLEIFPKLTQIYISGVNNKVRKVTNLARGMPALQRVSVESQEEVEIWKEMLAEKGNNPAVGVVVDSELGRAKMKMFR